MIYPQKRGKGFQRKVTFYILLWSCLKQFSRTVFWDSTALRLSYNCINVDALRELGIILFAWHSRTSCSNTPLCKGILRMPDFILDVQGLETTFRTPDGVVHAVNGVSFGLLEGETLGVVGESGCGKSVTMLSILGLIATPPGKVEAGKAEFFGQDLLKMSKDEMRAVRGAQIGMVFQDPMTSLNPV